MPFWNYVGPSRSAFTTIQITKEIHTQKARPFFWNVSKAIHFHYLLFILLQGSSQGLNNSSHHWPLHPPTEAQIYQVPVDLEPPNYSSRPLLNNASSRTMQERQQSRQTRLSHSAFVRRQQGSPATTAAEDLWLLQQNKFQDLSSGAGRTNSHIYMDLDSSSSSSESGTANKRTTARKSLSNYVVSQC